MSQKMIQNITPFWFIKLKKQNEQQFSMMSRIMENNKEYIVIFHFTVMSTSVVGDDIPDKFTVVANHLSPINNMVAFEFYQYLDTFDDILKSFAENNKLIYVDASWNSLKKDSDNILNRISIQITVTHIHDMVKQLMQELPGHLPNFRNFAVFSDSYYYNPKFYTDHTK